jgi:hypothetical protein
MKKYIINFIKKFSAVYRQLIVSKFNKYIVAFKKDFSELIGGIKYAFNDSLYDIKFNCSFKHNVFHYRMVFDNSIFNRNIFNRHMDNAFEICNKKMYKEYDVYRILVWVTCVTSDSLNDGKNERTFSLSETFSYIPSNSFIGGLNEFDRMYYLIKDISERYKTDYISNVDLSIYAYKQLN